MNCPLDYSLCNQTVTVYRLAGGEVTRYEMENACFSPKTVKNTDTSGEEMGKPFLLILPGENISLIPGDRVFQGVGPFVTKEAWPEFLPATVPELFIAQYVKPCYWMGTLCHTEAGSD